MNKSLNYENIILSPKYSECVSRQELDTSVDFAGRTWKLGVVPANMSSCIDLNLYKFLIENNYFAIMHRFCQNDLFVESIQNCSFVSISLGVKQIDYELINLIQEKKYKVDCITVDIANGWGANLKNIVRYIRQVLGNNVYIIGGNIPGNPNAVKDLISWGCNAAKVGLSMGRACCTYSVCGFGTPMFSAILEASRVGFPIVADGQVRNIGDICKSFVAGSSMTMVGSLFSQCSDSPAPIENGKKIYYGSSSYRQRGENKNIEGKDVPMEIGKTYKELLTEIKEGIQSGMSYGNCKSIQDLRNVEYIEV